MLIKCLSVDIMSLTQCRILGHGNPMSWTITLVCDYADAIGLPWDGRVTAMEGANVAGGSPQAICYAISTGSPGAVICWLSRLAR